MNDNANTTVLNFLFSFYTYFIPFGLAHVCSCLGRAQNKNIVFYLFKISPRAAAGIITQNNDVVIRPLCMWTSVSAATKKVEILVWVS